MTDTAAAASETGRSYTQLYIGGRWVDAAGTDRIEVISPHTEEVVGHAPEATTTDVDRAVDAARRAFDSGAWSEADPAERIAVLTRLAEIYERRAGEIAELITAEMGTPISVSRQFQGPGPVAILRTFLGLAEEVAWEERRSGFMGEAIVRREPVGVVAAIVPWNVPQILIMAKLAPALLAGCSVVVKPAPETPLDALLLGELLDEAGVPDGVVSILPAGREVGEHLVRHPGVDKVSFTGSTAAGRRIGAICGEQLKRVSLELGGKSAAIVLDDADLETTVEGLKFASLMFSGEACVAQTRVLASRRRYTEVVEALAEGVGGMQVGDPFDPATEIGPLVARRQQERVEGYIALGEQEGARVALGGGGRPDGLDRGWYVRPTVFADVDNGMRIAREEIFGPVLAVIPFEDERDAIRLANDSEYGLAGSVWTGDEERGLDVARRVRTGTFGVNRYTLNFIAPLGGYKASGIGREYGREGLEEYLELKTVHPPA
jgi:betaine-aldehyde dehydrogenase